MTDKQLRRQKEILEMSPKGRFTKKIYRDSIEIRGAPIQGILGREK
jgi:hypothetical protein